MASIPAWVWPVPTNWKEHAMKRWGRGLGGLAALGAVLAAGPVQAEAAVLSAKLTGTGTPAGSATFRVEADTELGDFCYVVVTKGLGKLKDAVIVAADAAADAKPLVTMELTGDDTDMCMAVEPKVLEPIVAEPGKYVVVVRSAAAPNGAVQGVLGKP
jgi:hypothetical protein